MRGLAYGLQRGTTAHRDPEQITDIAHVGISGTWHALMSARWKAASRAVQKRVAAQKPSSILASSGRSWDVGLPQTSSFCRSEARRVGKECISPSTLRWSPYHKKKI